ncbi:hypothetical protein CDL15_Pgr015851 [Punica granatum]|nr:hypothetical protein CDL15_Pgr015851 [Punica granatum]
MERYFIDLMLDQVKRGNRAGHTFNKQAWADMLAVFNAQFGSQYDKDVLKSRYSALWKQFNDVKILLGQSGFSWDESRQMLVADDYVWDAYIKAHPEARSYSTKSFMNFNDLCLIYGYTTADGRYSRSSHDVDFDDDVHGVNLVEGFCGQVPSTTERLRTDWTPAMDQYFIELLLDQVGRGNKSGDTFNKQAWNDMLASFNAKFGPQHGKRVLRHRYKKLWKYYSDAKALLKQNGFSWDEMQQMVTANDDVWDAYIKANPHARAYRKKTLPNYSDLALIYESTYDNYSQVQHKDPQDENPKIKPGEGKDSQNRPSGDRTRTYWTPPMDRYLVDLLLDQLLKGNKLGQTFITQAWTEMTASFNTTFRSKYERDVLKNRYKHLRKQFNEIKNLLKQDGFSWDESKEMLTAEDPVWDAYTKEHPDARAYRVKTLPSFHKLCVIFGEESFDGKYSKLTLNIDPDCELPLLIPGEDEIGQYTSSINSLAIVWTEQMDRYFIGQMLEIVHGGNRIGQISDGLEWSHIITPFNEKFGLHFDKSILEARYAFLMKQHDEISSLLSHSGFAWDEAREMVTAEDHVWEAYIKDRPEAIAYRNKSLGMYNGLRKICAVGVLAESFNEQGSSVMERTCNAQEMEGDRTFLDHRYTSLECQETDRQRKRPGSDSTEAEKSGKMLKTKAQLPADDYDATMISESLKERKNYTMECAISALQAIADVDDDLLLDACDLLEDERKAKRFLALDAPLRKKWLLRKLRP